MKRRSAAASTAAIESPLLTAQEAMAYLRRGRTFMTEHAAELGARRVGGRLMFILSDLNAYLERCRIRSVVAVPAPAPAPTAIRPRPGLKHESETNPLTGLPWGVYSPSAPAARIAQGGEG